MKALFLILILTISLTAQVHVAATTSVSANLGYEGVAFGGEAGVTNRFFTGDVGIETATKTDGGRGYAIRGRQSFRYHFGGKYFVGGEVQESYYNVRAYNKTNLFTGGSVGIVKDRVTYSVRVMHDIAQSKTLYPNKQNFIEFSGEYFSPRHLYFRPSLAISHSKSYPAIGVFEKTAYTVRIAVGYWRGKAK